LVAPGTSGARWNDYLSVGNVKVGVRFTDVTSQTVSTRYFHTDHLGSVAVITDENGMVVERLSYDAWGKRRFANGADDPAGSIESLTTRGFTGHEELDSVGLVHMNGRVYDPLVGRMMSPDPTVPDALNAQAWNRYSYVGNDPLTFTDPSGYSWLSSFFHSIGNAVSSLFQRVPILRAVVQIAVAALLSFTGVGVVVAAAASAAIVNGLSGGNLGTMLRAGAIAGATAFAFDTVGTLTLGPAHATPTIGSDAYFANVAGHAGVGCLTSVASGGSCQNGALSAAAGAASSPLVNVAFPDPHGNSGDFIGATAATGIVGGLASVAGGGKFENGAVTAAFGYLFNQAAHGGNDPNERHQMGVDAAMSDYVERGYAVIRQSSVAVEVPGFDTPRYYDFIVQDPVSGYNIGVEVKTTLYDTIRLNTAQVAKDVVVMQQGGRSPLLGLSVAGVGYATYCWGCGTVDFRSTVLHSTLRAANIPFTHGGKPGELRP
jgi:RHS repeat-associated protein